MNKLTKAQQAEERQEAVNTLLTILKPSDVVYTKLDHVSSSGMSRQISVYVARMGEEGSQLGATPYIKNITYFVAKATSRKQGSKGGVNCHGCGMDMGYELVYNLSRTLFPEGFCTGHEYSGELHYLSSSKTEFSEIKKLFPEWAFKSGRNGNTSGWDNDGGYALKQQWL